MKSECLYQLYCYSMCFQCNFTNMALVLFCSSTGRKVEDPELLEAIRLTIINNLLEYHPVITYSFY